MGQKCEKCFALVRRKRIDPVSGPITTHWPAISYLPMSVSSVVVLLSMIGKHASFFGAAYLLTSIGDVRQHLSRTFWLGRFVRQDFQPHLLSSSVVLLLDFHMRESASAATTVSVADSRRSSSYVSVDVPRSLHFHSATSSTDSDSSALPGCHLENNISRYVTYPTGASGVAYDSQLDPVPIGHVDLPVTPGHFIFPLELGFPSDHQFVEEVHIRPFLNLHRYIMTREPPLVTYPLSRPAAPPVPEHCQVLVRGDGMADENLCFFDVTGFYTTDEVTVELSEYAWCDPLQFPMRYWFQGGPRPVFLVLPITPSAQAYFRLYQRHPRAPDINLAMNLADRELGLAIRRIVLPWLFQYPGWGLVRVGHVEPISSSAVV